MQNTADYEPITFEEIAIIMINVGLIFVSQSKQPEKFFKTHQKIYYLVIWNFHLKLNPTCEFCCFVTTFVLL